MLQDSEEIFDDAEEEEKSSSSSSSLKSSCSSSDISIECNDDNENTMKDGHDDELTRITENEEEEISAL